MTDANHGTAANGMDDLAQIGAMRIEPRIAIEIIGALVGSATADQIEQHGAVVRTKQRLQIAPHGLIAAKTMHEHHGGCRARQRCIVAFVHADIVPIFYTHAASTLNISMWNVN
ncbi:hypothetical protein D3C81_1506450 [compost metagenome]